MPKIAKGQPHTSGAIVLPIISHVDSGKPPEAADNPITVITVPAIIQPIHTSNLTRIFLLRLNILFFFKNISSETEALTRFYLIFCAIFLC